MADIKPISQLSETATVAVGDEFIINKLEGVSFKTEIIKPGFLGPQLSAFVSISDLSNVSTVNPTTGQVLVWNGTEWTPVSPDAAQDYVLPPATIATLGGVIVGNNIIVGSDGKISISDYLPITGGTLLGNLTSGNNITAGTLNVTGASTMNTLSMQGLITFADNQIFPGTGGTGDVTSVNNVKPDGTGNVQISANDVGALPISGGTMSGPINAVNITASNDITSSGNIGGLTLSASNTLSSKDISASGKLTVDGNTILQATTINALTVGTTSTFTGAVTLNAGLAGTTGSFSGQVTIPTTPASDTDAASKKYVDDQVIASGAGTVVNVTAGNGLDTLSGNPITTDGTLFVEAEDSTIEVGTNGIKVNISELNNQITFPVSSVQGEIGAVVLTADDVDAVSATTGGTFGGSVVVSGNVTATKFIGDGSELEGIVIPSPITYKGTIDCTTDIAPLLPTSGDLYLNLVAGTAGDSWTGLTTLVANQFVLYKTNTWEAGAVLDGSAFVTLSTDQANISGAKTFTSQTTTFTDISAADITASGDVGITGALTGTTGTFTGVVSGVTPLSSADFTTKSYVDSKVSAAGGGTVESVNDIEPDAQGNVALTPANVNAWNSAGDTEFTNPCDVYTGTLSGNALRIYGGLKDSSPTLAFRVMTGAGAEEVEFSYPIELREGADTRKDLNFTQSGQHISFLDGQGNALEFAAPQTNADTGAITYDTYIRFNTGGTDQVMFFKKISAVTNEGIAFKELFPVKGSHINLEDNDADALDIINGGDIYIRFNTAAETVNFLKPIVAADIGTVDLFTTRIDFANTTGTTAQAGDINIVDNSNQALDITDESGNIYIRLSITKFTRNNLIAFLQESRHKRLDLVLHHTLQIRQFTSLNRIPSLKQYLIVIRKRIIISVIW